MIQAKRKGNKLAIALLASFSVLVVGVVGAYAHDLWANAYEPKDGVLKAEIGYGHGFPKVEPIPEARTHIFEPMRLITPGGIVEMKQKGANTNYEVDTNIKKGSVIVLSTYKPTFWSKGAEGWQMKNRAERPDATHVEEAAMSGKAILNIGGAADDFVTKPIGTKLEIVPMVNPAKVKAGGKFPVRVLFEGKPLKTAKVFATVEGFAPGDEKAKAFYSTTDLEGVVNIIPLKAGYWLASVTHTTPYQDKTQADESVNAATLAFHIGK